MIINAQRPDGPRPGRRADELSRLTAPRPASPVFSAPQPGTDFWFLGPGPAKAAAINLHLVNPDSQPAAVDVEIFTDTGPLQGNADTGIEVPPGGSVVQAVSKLVPGSRVVALHVRTSVGRVVAAVQAGAAWWRAASAPAQQVVVPGLPGAGTGPQAVPDRSRRERRAGARPGDHSRGHLRARRGRWYRRARGLGRGARPAVAERYSRRAAAAVSDSGDSGGGRGRPTRSPPRPARCSSKASSRTTSPAPGTPRRSSCRRLPAPRRCGSPRPARRGSLGAGQLVAIAAGHSSQRQRGRAARRARRLRDRDIARAGSGPVYAGRVLATRARGAMLITPVVSAPVVGDIAAHQRFCRGRRPMTGRPYVHRPAASLAGQSRLRHERTAVWPCPQVGAFRDLTVC